MNIYEYTPPRPINVLVTSLIVLNNLFLAFVNLIGYFLKLYSVFSDETWNMMKYEKILKNMKNEGILQFSISLFYVSLVLSLVQTATMRKAINLLLQ